MVQIWSKRAVILECNLNHCVQSLLRHDVVFFQDFFKKLQNNVAKQFQCYIFNSMVLFYKAFGNTK